MRFLSEEWFECLESDVDTGDGLLRLRYVISGISDGIVEYRIVLPSGSVLRGPGEADVTFEMDHSTAESIYLGQQNAQECVLDGRITVIGDPAPLLDHRDLLATLPSVFEHHRAASETHDA